VVPAALRARRACIIVTACLVAAMTGGPVGAQRAPLAPNDVQRWADLLRIEDSRRPDSAVVMRALSARHPVVQRAALRTIGRNRIVSLYPLLRATLQQRTRDTARTADAAFALGIARDTTACATLATALRRDVSTGIAAAWSLGELGGACAETAALLRAAARDSVALSTPVLAALVQSAAAARVTERDPLRVLAAAPRTARSVRWSALWALGRLRDSAATRTALRYATFRDPRIAEVAVRLLASPLVRDPQLRDSAHRVAVAALTRGHPHVRISAARAAASYDSAAPHPLLLALYDRERDANVRLTLLDGIAPRVPVGSTLWTALWQRDTAWVSRGALLADALRRDPSSVRPLLTLDLVSDPRARLLILDAMRTRPTFLADSLGFLLAAADTAWQVRARALIVMRSIDRDSLPAAYRTAMRTALQDADDDVREAAASALGRHGIADDVPALLDAYRRETANPSGVDVQLAILGALAEWHLRDSVSVPVALFRTLELPQDLRAERALARIPALAAAAQRARAPRFADSSYARIVREIAWPSAVAGGPVLVWRTPHGDITARLHGDVAPLTVWNIMALARDGFYRGTRFHRVVPAFVAQDGDPRGSGGGGPGYAIPDELNRRWYTRGALGMALSGPDTGGSQYFFTLSPQPHLDGRYTVFGTVTGGQAAMDALLQGDAVLSIGPRR
jgi:cyclophilin family peptidyl-prolyl cis-trans isomerase